MAELTSDEVQRYSRHLIMPEVGVDGQRGSRPRACCASAPADSDRRRRCISPPPASARSASSTSTSSTSATCSGRSFHGTRDVGRSKLRVGERSRCATSTRDVTIEPHETRSPSKNALELFGLRRHPRRHRQFPDALSGQRRLRVARQAERLRQHLPVRGPGVGVRRARRALLPLPVSRAAAAGTGAELRRRRRARRAARHHRHDSGDRDASS